MVRFTSPARSPVMTSSSAPVLPVTAGSVAVLGQKRKLPFANSSPNVSRMSAGASALHAPSSVGGGKGPSSSPRGGYRVTPSSSDSDLSGIAPSDYWRSLLEEWNVPMLDSAEISGYNNSSGGSFLETTSDRIEAYQNIELLSAVRRRDLAKLKQIASQNAAKGRTMDACNRFGESILHLACRKGSLDVVQLLVGEADDVGLDCSLLVRDDYGRTVLHDACWTVSPPWELIKLILKKAPVLWRLTDVRGHLALQYAPKCVWTEWIAFLEGNESALRRIMVESYRNDRVGGQQPAAKRRAIPSTITASEERGGGVSSSEKTTMRGPQQHQQGRTGASCMGNDPAIESNNVASTARGIYSGAAAAPRQRQPQQGRTSGSSGPVATPVAGSQAATASPTWPILKATATAAIGLAGKPAESRSSTSHKQAMAILAGALSQQQANSGIMKALSQQQQQDGAQQVMQRMPLRAQHATVMALPSPSPFQQQRQLQSSGPATAALAQQVSPSNFPAPSQQQQRQPPTQAIHSQQRQPAALRSEPSPPTLKQAIPYAPSISMIAARLAGYQRVTNVQNQVSVGGAGQQQEQPIQQGLLGMQGIVHEKVRAVPHGIQSVQQQPTRVLQVAAVPPPPQLTAVATLPAGVQSELQYSGMPTAIINQAASILSSSSHPQEQEAQSSSPTMATAPVPNNPQHGALTTTCDKQLESAACKTGPVDGTTVTSSPSMLSSSASPPSAIKNDVGVSNDDNNISKTGEADKKKRIVG